MSRDDVKPPRCPDPTSTDRIRPNTLLLLLLCTRRRKKTFFRFGKPNTKSVRPVWGVFVRVHAACLCRDRRFGLRSGPRMHVRVLPIGGRTAETSPERSDASDGHFRFICPLRGGFRRIFRPPSSYDPSRICASRQNGAGREPSATRVEPSAYTVRPT